ncbi:MAG: C25 family cysteine peptidase [Pyrinomonadaceae bacterium]
MRGIRLSNQAGRILVALGLTLSIVLTPAIIPAAAGDSRTERFAQNETKILSVTATATEDGVLIEWRTSYEIDNVGFNLYREQGGRRTKVNGSLIPGSLLIVGEGVPLRGGYSYSAFDRGGTLAATYQLESINLEGKISLDATLAVASRQGINRPYLKHEADSTLGADAAADLTQRSWPASLKDEQSANGAIEDQWVIASQPALKIGVRQSGWYRLTQAQLVAAGMDPATDAANLRMFVGAREMAIRVSRSNGALGAGDFIEFYGSGVDTLATDTQTYWLTGGTAPGRRITIPGQVSHDGGPGRELPIPYILPQAPDSGRFLSLPRDWFRPALEATETSASERREAVAATVEPARREEERNLSDDVPPPNENRVVSRPVEAEPANITLKSGTTTVFGKAAVAPVRPVPAARRKAARVSKSRKRRQKTRKFSHRPVQKRNHAADTATVTPNFLQVIERKERGTYFSSLQNGEIANFFGQVLTSPGTITQPLNLNGVDLTADGPAQLQVALQGASSATHRVNVFLNDVSVGSFNFSFLNNAVASYSIPIASLREGNNDLKLVSLDGSGLVLVDYARLTFPRQYRAQNNSLNFSARFNQTVKVEGFTTANLRVLDITDPLSVEEVRPIVETSGAGYAITVLPTGARTKGRRSLVAFAADQFQQPAAVTFNQPSSINTNSNGADLLIISHANFLASAAPLESLRQGQGLATKRVDVEDIFDEFNFGVRSPYALRDFLARAAAQWSPAPRYVILLGDGTYDPRNYQALGNTDFVPTKLIDTVFMETASDDWLADFNDDGIPEMSVGRLPARTVAEANIMIGKIVNFAPAVVPQSALLVADAQGSYYFNFEAANQQVAALLPPSITVQTVNRRTEPSDAAAKANIIAKFNAGQAVVNYSGHGNVNAWAGSIFTSADALALTNMNTGLPFVVVMDCLNGYFVEPRILGEGLAESLIKAPNGGSVASFASSGLTIPDGQHEMSNRLYQLLYGGTSLPLGDVVKQAKLATVDIDVRRTWIFFGDPSMKIR